MSNMHSDGRPEPDTLQQIGDVCRGIVEKERSVRKMLVRENPIQSRDQIGLSGSRQKRSYIKLTPLGSTRPLCRVTSRPCCTVSLSGPCIQRLSGTTNPRLGWFSISGVYKSLQASRSKCFTGFPSGTMTSPGSDSNKSMTSRSRKGTRTSMALAMEKTSPSRKSVLWR